MRLLGSAGEALAVLLDLVVPAGCGGCGEPPGTGRPATGGLCAACDRALAAAAPRRVRPAPEPPGLPRCLALAGYAGALRTALLAYKERGRRELAGPLGTRLADVVVAGLAGAAPRRTPVVLVPVPATAAAARRRYGDHMSVLARPAARRLAELGWPAAVYRPLRARPRADSAGLTGPQRRAAAAASLVLARGATGPLTAAVDRGARLVLVDDIVTTGATLAVAAERLRAAGLPVPLAAVLAATQRHPGPGSPSVPASPPPAAH